MRKIILIICASVVIAGCGVENQQVAAPNSPAPLGTNDSVAMRSGDDILIGGVTEGSMTKAATTSYNQDGGIYNVEHNALGEQKGFSDLCEGKLDMVDSTRPISRDEWIKCQKSGFEVVQLQVGSDAVVVVTRAETNTGADCLSLPNVRDLYRAGSPIYNWRQLEYEDQPLTVIGPALNHNGFAYFGKNVLESSSPSLLDFRSDYKAYGSDQAIRQALIGSELDLILVKRYAIDRRAFTSARSEFEKAKVSWRLANQELRAAVKDRTKGIRDKRSTAQQARDQKRQDTAYTKESIANEYMIETQTIFRKSQSALRQSTSATKRQKALAGRIAYLRFSYYKFYTDQLRPLEITESDSPRNCIFPDQKTVMQGTYPLSTRLLITTTTQSLQRDSVQDYLSAYLSNAPTIAKKLHMVALPEGVLKMEQAMLTGKPKLVEYDTPENDTQQDIQPAL